MAINKKIIKLQEAEKKASQLFEEIQQRNLIKAGLSEKELNRQVYDLAYEMFGIKKYWHKRIVRAGSNTLLPYRHNPPDLILQTDDILFLDFGPVFDDWEADFGRTFVIGSNSEKLKLQNDVALAWLDGRNYFFDRWDTISGADFFRFTERLAIKYGWQYGNEHCGHLIGNFPHEKLQGEEVTNYIHPENFTRMKAPDRNGNERFWIYEIHFIDRQNGFGGFYEQMLQ